MEFWDLYDRNGNPTGKSCIRGSQIPDGYYHLVIHAWIKNKKGEYLISLRSDKKSTFPSMWDCVVGAVIKGESSINGALREVKEEVGLVFSPSDGKLIKKIIRETINGVKYNEIANVWLFEYDGPVNLKDATTDEVSEIKWMSRDEINKLIANKKMVPTLYYFLTDRNFNSIDNDLVL